jgi:predicted nucleic acid-binding protein
MARSGAIQPERGASEGRPLIAADTSTWIAFLQGDNGADVELLDLALRDQQVVMPPVVLTELLSDPKLSPDVAKTLCEVPLIETDAGYWQRAGQLRGQVLASRRKARLGDALIAQSCLDRGIPLVTRDRDFKAFAAAAALDILAS